MLVNVTVYIICHSQDIHKSLGTIDINLTLMPYFNAGAIAVYTICQSHGTHKSPGLLFNILVETKTQYDNMLSNQVYSYQV
jgi:hypothetical protein